MKKNDPNEIIKGRGAQLITRNSFLQNERGIFEKEGIDEDLDLNQKTKFYFDHPKKIINKVDSPDLGMAYSMNPYQGCEHGCIYCYARNTHEYWGFSAGLDFEQKIIVKKEIPEVLRKQLQNPKWKVMPIMLSGNTDCYQPAEKRFKITRGILEVMLDFKHPVSIITKNQLILRDLDYLKELQRDNLVSVNVSITSLKESLRRKLEPRTASATNRLKVVEKLSDVNIPVNVMVAPIIPGLNSHEIPDLVKAAADHGALSAAYTMVRLNGAIGEIFTDWVTKAFPNKANKVLRQIKECHNGKLNDSRFGIRTRGEGVVAEQVNRLFKISKQKHFKDRKMPLLNLDAFKRKGGTQLSIW